MEIRLNMGETRKQAKRQRQKQKRTKKREKNKRDTDRSTETEKKTQTEIVRKIYRQLGVELVLAIHPQIVLSKETRLGAMRAQYQRKDYERTRMKIRHVN